MNDYTVLQSAIKILEQFSNKSLTSTLISTNGISILQVVVFGNKIPNMPRIRDEMVIVQFQHARIC